MELFHLHPAAVHFPVALLSLGFTVACLYAARGKPAWLAEAAPWLLWLGTASVWAALGLGVLAERTAPHVPPAWEVLADHETLAYWTAWMFTAAGGLQYWLRRRPPRSRTLPGLLLAIWLVGLGVMGRTAYLGGRLVFAFGVGAAEAGE